MSIRFVYVQTCAMTPSQFWDRRADAYSKKPVPDLEAYEQTLERVRAHLTPNDRVLELGCGTGMTARKLAACAREIVATDYSAEMIAIATAKAGLEGLSHVRFQRCTLDDETLAASSFARVDGSSRRLPASAIAVSRCVSRSRCSASLALRLT